ncbi:MAG: 4-hydroxy-tetrahydrodipicolinate synthase (EC [uncultured Thiotrichaceae bacterium]|uniref:4-hydroxy-tetrahydrodipicolinate synthase n=1 Tax=uncultured Thiotrichaceae bacterium TaxID=298394 RepID=A0A6S6UAS4_9GAMM|nr:MAG: 4-hydroxy-tetrahydrodipicolinate synthase (EC [uncultured Thiotrichaceae bacterium]
MFRGSMVALITPMHEDGAIDEAALEQLVAFHIENNTDAIVAVGTTGESATLSHQENSRVIRRVVELVGGKIPVIAGTGSNSTAEALALTQKAMADGADACLLVTPYYNKPTQEGLYQHYKLIAEKAAIPQILYNVPGRTSCDLLPETVERLAGISNIVGLKEATGDLDRAKYLIESCGDQLDIYSGDDATAMELMLMGGKGDISVTANVVPAEMHVMCKAAIEGDRETASRINDQIMPLHEKLFLEANPIPVKWAMHKMGYGSTGLRLPLTVFAEDYHQTLLDAMAASGVSI